ncbi:MAG: radical SAM-associated putative lipoprotein [Bacteroidales bacterium]|nr:radical SAM-associated putative lipoprotein [Bacteroidales bacterium]
MKSVFQKFLRLLGPSIVGMLGFSSCGDEGILLGEDEPNWCAYGTPTCKFKVELTVTDESGNALNGINVIPSVKYLTLDEQDYSMFTGKDTLTTNRVGKITHLYMFMGSPETLKVYFEDTDKNREGGSFARDSAEFSAVKTGEGKGWVIGEWAVSGNKILKKK